MFERPGGSVAVLGRFGGRDYWQVGQLNAGPAGIAVGVAEGNIATRWRTPQFDNLAITPGGTSARPTSSGNSCRIDPARGAYGE